MTSANRHAAPEQGSWSVPGAAPAYPPSGETTSARYRGRPGVVALVVAVVELVVIAAAGNQSVSKHTDRYASDHLNSFLGRAVGSVLQFSWRVTPLSGDNQGGFHVYYSQLTTIAVFVVVSALLTLVVARGPVTFWRAFFGVWTAVLAAACVARVAGSFVSKPLTPDADRATYAVFDSVSGLTVFFGAVLGLIAALLAALIAVSTRRTVEAPVAAAAPPEPAYTPETPPPFYGSTPARDQNPVDRYPVDPRAENETTALPSLSKEPGGAHSTQQLPEVPDEQQGQAEDVDNRTTQIPRFDPRGGQNWTPPEGDGGATQALPNAPDDR